jgi:hypothetical protein
MSEQPRADSKGMHYAGLIKDVLFETPTERAVSQRNRPAYSSIRERS